MEDTQLVEEGVQELKIQEDAPKATEEAASGGGWEENAVKMMAGGPAEDHDEEEAPQQPQPPQAAAAEEEYGDEDEEGPSQKPAVATREPDTRDHLSVVFIGHVDAGKSTIAGNIMVITGQVDERTVDKYKREAESTAGGSWYLAFIMDQNKEEREKGKTVEVGRAHFATEKRRFTILDAPGHKNYVPNMIGGAQQADVAVLVISARKGEFETGFDRGGQTREHATLAKTLGVRQLVVVINKMDDKTVEWGKDRYDEIVGKLTPFLKQTGFGPKAITFLPLSGYTGINLKEPIPSGLCPWYQGPPLLEVLSNLRQPPRKADGPLRIPVLDKYKEAGKLIIMGKVESGTIAMGQDVMVMPGRQRGTVIFLGTDLVEQDKIGPGENIRLSISGIPDEGVRSGFVVCDEEHPAAAVSKFEAQIVVMDLLRHKPIFSPGYSAVCHIHTAVEECKITHLLAGVDPKTGKPTKKKPKYVKKGEMVIARIELTQTVCMELFESFQALGRFTLRDEGKTIAIGKVLRLPKSKAPEGN
ncbi:G1 to S phase transition 2 [Balamuthia mandrillaris]